MGATQLPVAIERVRCEFEQWRAHKRGRERIPERLWSVAAEAARRHGVHAVSRAVRLEHSALRRRVEEEPAGFIELECLSAMEGVGCTVELEKGNGTRMRICVRDGASVDWARMKEAFLGG